MDFVSKDIGFGHEDDPRPFAPSHELATPGREDETQDIRRYFMLLVRNWQLLLICLGAALLLGAAGTFLMTPIYRAMATIQIEREATKVLDVQDVEPAVEALETERFLQTQVDLIQSRSLAEQVSNSLGLMAHYDSFLQRMHERPATVTGFSPAQIRDVRQTQIIQALTDHLHVDWTRSSRLVSISFDSPDRALAADVSNSFASNYIAGNLDRRFQSTAYARNFLEKRLNQIKAKLEDSERQMIDYARRERLIDASEGDQTGQSRGPKSLTTANLVQINDTFSAAQSARIQAEQRWLQSQGPAVFNLPEVIQNPAVQVLLEKRAASESEYQDGLKIFKADYPTMLQLQAQTKQLNSEIDMAAQSIRNTIRTQYKIALAQENSLRAAVEQLKGATLNEQTRGIRYNILKREADTNRVLYDGLLQRYKEISLAGGLAVNNISTVDAALPPERPSSPKLFKNVAIAGVLGLILAILYILINDRFDDTVRSPGDLEEKLGLMLVGVVPLLPKATIMSDALEDSRSEASEAYTSIRAALQFASPQGIPSPLLITSSQQSEGKSTTSIAIAMSVARTGRSVLLVDADLRRPSMHNLIGLSRDKGLTNILTGQADQTSMTQTTSIPNLSFVACGPLPIDPAELLAGKAMVDFLESATKMYDVIIIDGPPIMGLADAPILSSVSHGTVFVLEAGRTHRGQSRVAIKRLRAAGTRLVGAILTKYDTKNGASYDSAYAYAYTYNYRERPEA